MVVGHTYDMGPNCFNVGVHHPPFPIFDNKECNRFLEMEKEVEIGIKIVASIYLTVIGNELPTAFEVARINDVSEEGIGTVITYVEGEGPYSSKLSSFRYIVEESKEIIDKAIERAKGYRDAAIEKINSLLE